MECAVNSSSSTTGTAATDPITASTAAPDANDPSIQDAFSEQEDNVEPTPDEDDPEADEEQTQIPNNDFSTFSGQL